jgi:hypothetical protein
VRNWLRKWLGVTDEDDLSIKDLAYGEVKHWEGDWHVLDRIRRLESANEKLWEEFNHIKAGLKPPFAQRMMQIRESLKLLTSFANELQRDMEEKK